MPRGYGYEPPAPRQPGVPPSGPPYGYQSDLYGATKNQPGVYTGTSQYNNMMSMYGQNPGDGGLMAGYGRLEGLNSPSVGAGEFNALMAQIDPSLGGFQRRRILQLLAQERNYRPRSSAVLMQGYARPT